jgi:SpoVK/Ycf46/Vps4 family AAA+-type ATPase
MDGMCSVSSAGANDSEESGKSKIVTVIGATNRPWDLDEALRRRFEKRVYIPLPNIKGREELFKINLKNVQTERIDFEKLIKMTEGYSGADIANV